jgi:hypothetical protein
MCRIAAVPAVIVSSALLRIGYRVTRHPRMGAVEEPEVALREPQSNQRLRRKRLSQVAVQEPCGCCGGTIVESALRA